MGTALIIAVLAAWPGIAHPPPSPAALRYRQELKRLQQQMLMEVGSAENEHWARAARAARMRAGPAPAVTRRISGRPLGVLASLPGSLASELLPPDVAVSDPTSDMSPSSCQSEVSIAARGDSLLAVWNDGEQLQQGSTGLGYGFSTDGGRTWTDGRGVPVGGGVDTWVADPVVALDPKTGRFYLAAVAVASGPLNGLAVIEGRFAGATFQWQRPHVVRATRDTLLDKPWLAADSSSRTLAISYTSFYQKPQGAGKTKGDEIQLQRSTDGNSTWDPPLVLSEPAEDGLVQGSRPGIGPGGEIHVVWKTIDTTVAGGGRDPIRARTSRDGGATFGPIVQVARVFTDFTSGAPGFGRGNGLGFPSLAVDRSAGPHRGRVYVAWDESLDYYDDLLGTQGEREEIEPNDRTLDATPFALGETVRGRSDPVGDADWYRFHARQGQTVVVYLDSLSKDIDLTLRLVCSDRQTRLAYSTSTVVRPRIVLYTIPADGDYYVNVTWRGGPGPVGGYRMVTGAAERGSERGRDHRDLFEAHSDDGITWSEPVRVNQDPPTFDDWLVELAVSDDGTLHSAWYDWRDAPPSTCGGASNVYLARSYDGGETWRELGPVSRETTAWTEVSSDLEANQGDYIGLAAGEQAAFIAWGDGRLGTPDVYMSAWPLAPDVEPPDVSAGPGSVRLAWLAPGGAGITASVYRRTEATDWESRDVIVADASGVLAYEDRAVTPGTRYGYRLGLRFGDVEVPMGEVWVAVPTQALALAIGRVQPNPSFGSLQVSYVLPEDAPARVQLLDVTGRQIVERTIGGLGPGTLRLGGERALAPGLYWIRVSQSGRSVSAKAIVLSR